MIEVRFHGRGGQGAVTSAELLAAAAFHGGREAQAFPFFGVERRGAPVQAFCRIDEKRIRLHQNVYEPDYLVVLDDTLFSSVNIFEGLKEKGVVLIASKKPATDFKAPKPSQKVFTVDAFGIARSVLGKPIVNTAVLGAFAKITGLVTVDNVKKAVLEHFPRELGEKNALAVQKCYDSA
ncbi:MAG: pyruvate ferredoxin oxidoreductase subunit gamma [Candidatus Micrarchaeota archaeon]|nr:pyruvate ferredoxin oxidoreductase subunit gamma [Candidatus Micrarchaeota archaeon]